MKHIVFVLGSYYPRFSAVGLCAQRVITELSSRYKISVLAVKDEQAQEPKITLEGVDIYRVTTPDIETRARLGHRLRAAKNSLDRLQLLLLRARATLRRLVAPVTVDNKLVEAYTRQLQQIPDIDVIVPLVFPFESVVAALKYASSSKVMVIPYLFDNFVESRSLHVLAVARRIKRQRHLQLEAEMIERSDVILSMHPLEPHFHRHFGELADRKFRYLEHPLLSRKEVSQIPKSTAIRMVYTGAFVRDVREPDYMLNLLDTVDLGRAAVADFYVMGSAAARVQTKLTKFGLQIHNNGQVSKQIADSAVELANILLNAGEIEGRQISSKIFEYMAVGRPIVHFAYKEGDNVTRILERYPLALCLVQDLDEMDNNRKKFQKFVRDNANKSVSFDQVAKIFPEALPRTSADIFTEIIEAHC